MDKAMSMKVSKAKLAAAAISLARACRARMSAPVQSALMAAVRAGDLAAVEALLAGGADVDESDGSGMTALLEAAIEDLPGMVPRLLAAGASVDAVDAEGWTALMHAALFGHAGAARALLAARANPDPLNAAGDSARTLAEDADAEVAGMIAAAEARRLADACGAAAAGLEGEAQAPAEGRALRRAAPRL